METNDANVVQATYTYGNDLISAKIGEIRGYYHYDGLGSVVAMLEDYPCQLYEQYSYDAFGKVVIRDAGGDVYDESLIGNRFFFTGRELDYETGLYYYRARYYSPKLGRFLQPDPIGYADSLNLYQYCLNNPVNFVDPWGLLGEGGIDEGKLPGHRDLGAGRGNPNKGGYFDNAKLDNRLETSPIVQPWLHFGDRADIERKLEKANAAGNKKLYEEFLHEGQDTFFHGKGLGGMIDHIIRGAEVDNPYDKNGNLKQSYKDADAWTKTQIEKWDKIHPTNADKLVSEKKS